jgi:hypothetical protein
MKTAVLKMCVFKDGKPFKMSVEDEFKAKDLGFKKQKDSGIYIRKFRILIDGVPFSFYKPNGGNCLTIYKIAPGDHTVSFDLKSVSYTTLQPEKNYERYFKADLLYKTKVNLVQGPTAKVVINQSSNKISLYQALDKAPVKDCEKGCDVPIGIPVYLMKKAEDEKVKCPIRYDLVVADEKEKNLKCYNDAKIIRQLNELVEEKNIMCKVNLEYAYFKVYGEGCITTPEAGKDGISFKLPEIKMLPLDKQKFNYFWQINSEKRKPYKFTGDRKGPERTPAQGDEIKFFEERNL